MRFSQRDHLPVSLRTIAPDDLCHLERQRVLDARAHDNVIARAWGDAQFRHQYFAGANEEIAAPHRIEQCAIVIEGRQRRRLYIVDVHVRIRAQCVPSI